MHEVNEAQGSGTTVGFHVTPGYGELAVERLGYSQAGRDEERR